MLRFIASALLLFPILAVAEEALPLSEPEAAQVEQKRLPPAINSPAQRIAETVENISQANTGQALPTWGALRLLNTELAPNTSATLDWYSGHLPGGFELPTPVIAIHGKQSGPRVCLTAAIHGDEVNGVEIARRVVTDLDPAKLKGTIISIPVVNIDGLWRKDRYMSDRRDLNRAFPGSPNGSTASRVAYSLFTSIIKDCDSLIDLHSGSMFRENVTQLRADLTVPEVAELAQQFGAISVVQSIAPSGSLRGAATAEGIPSVVMEVGGPYTVDEKLVETAVKALQSYLSSVEMLPRSFFWSSPQPIFYASRWVRSRDGGILINKVPLGAKVDQGQLLGTVSNPITGSLEEITAPFDAVVLGRAQNQFVSAGYAMYNLGERRQVEELEEEAVQEKQQAVATTVKQQGLDNERLTPTTSEPNLTTDTAPNPDRTEPEDEDG